MLRIDEVLYLDPFPMAPRAQGLLVVPRTPSGPFTALAEKFEALFVSGLPDPEPPRDTSNVREQFASLIRAADGPALEWAAELYFATPATRSEHLVVEPLSAAGGWLRTAGSKGSQRVDRPAVRARPRGSGRARS
jgi:hypothetical protein